LLQPTAADTEATARHLKNLLALHLALRPAEDKTTLDETAVSRAAREFGGGADSLALYRQLYAANRLRRAGVAPQAVGALMGAAPAGVDAGLDQPYSVIAIMSDDYLRLSQSGAFANIQPVLTPAQRLAFSRVVRGRIEEMAGWAYLAQNDAGEALVRFRRALSVLPENTSWWRSAQWHQGLALEAQSKPREALAAYIKGYNKNAPDVVRRALIERLYRQVNGNTDGLDEQIGPAPVIAAAPAPEVTPTPLIEATPTPEVKAEATPEDKPAPTPAPKEEPTPEAAPTPEPAPAPKVEVKPEVTPAPPDETTPAPLPTPTPESLPAPTPEATPAPTATPEIKAGAAPETTPTPETTTAAPPSEEPKKGEAAPESAPPETVEKKEQPPAGGTRPRRVNAPESESPADKGKKKDKPKKPGRR
jgi:tetratricopeptide (TPR) repeat protein